MRRVNAAEEKKENKDSWMVEIGESFGFHDHSKYELELEKKSIYKWPNDFAIAPGMLMHQTPQLASNGLAIASCMLMHQTPQVASFGPYHNGKEHLQPMEYHKERALYRILKGRSDLLYAFIDSLKGVEQELRNSYDNLDPKLSFDSFLRMMLLDGCFMIELLRNGNSSEPDLVFSKPGASGISITGFRDTCILAFRGVRFCTGIGANVSRLVDESLHILDMYMKCLIMENAPNEQKHPSAVDFIKSAQSMLHVTGKKLMSKLLEIPIFFIRPKPGKHDLRVRSAMRFHEAGVEFKVTKPNGLRIHFSEGVLTLPPILIEDYTAAIYMNMMAFERMHPKLWRDRRVTSYMGFMDNLIDTAEDMSLLCSRGIMDNFLGSNEEAAEVFNNLAVGVSYCLDPEVHKPLHKYVASGWNAAKAVLGVFHVKIFSCICDCLVVGLLLLA
ncbi:UPF0481 protein At3g47200-like [Nymphaea colorata]|uniref:UPF0481 protein At3g47200-like n=1 Tax=Nymphaea colorata TaxID=210225 RepID=UPI00129D38C4|nr:UPF0481 protein At3g47200-like [Nymphaea colorata]